jgi:hypothetical protein
VRPVLELIGLRFELISELVRIFLAHLSHLPAGRSG